MIHRMLSVMYLEWDIEWEISMVVAISTVLLIGFILGGSTVYLVENHLRAKEMNKIYKLTESLELIFLPGCCGKEVLTPPMK